MLYPGSTSCFDCSLHTSGGGGYCSGGNISSTCGSGCTASTVAGYVCEASFKKSFLRQKNKHRLLSGGVCMAAGLSVLLRVASISSLADGVDNIQGTVSPVYSAPYGVNAAAFGAAAQFLLKFQAYFPSADEGCFSVASGMDEQFHGKAVGKVNGGLFDFVRGNGDFQSVVLILKLFSNRSNNLLSLRISII